MRKIAIIGAGQAGLQLALSLLEHHYEVTVFSAVTPDQLQRSRPLSTQVMFEPALAAERRFDLNPWEAATPPLAGTRVTLADPPGQPVLTVNAHLDYPARSIDQRIKMATWLEFAEHRGARVIYQTMTATDVDALAASGRHDLVVVAAGRSDLGAIFDPDPARTIHAGPQRVLSAAYLHGLEPDPGWSAGHMGFHPLPGIGELFSFPALTFGGTCDILVWEAIIDGPADRGPDGPLSPQQILGLILDLLDDFAPQVAARTRAVALADPLGALYGRITPRVRRPVAYLPAGGIALGLGDVVVTQDPIAGQGANSAAKCADHYLRAILAHGGEPFSAEWMIDTFEGFWAEHGDAVQRLCAAMLAPPQPHHFDIFATAAAYPAVAARFANGLADPRDLGWFTDPVQAAAYLGDAAGITPRAELVPSAAAARVR